MEATSKERKSIDIQATAHLHRDIAGQLPAAHALSGCDTVAQLWGIGKKKTRVVEMLKAGRQLAELGNSSAALVDAVRESTAFITACYGYDKLNNVGYSVQDVKSEHCKSQYCFRTKVDVPTNASFQPNALRAHLQCGIWTHANEANLPDIDPTMHGWKRDAINKTMTPTLLRIASCN